MLNFRAALVLTIVSLTAWAPPAAATTITYQATNTAGTEWRYDYVLSAAAGEAPITEFTIFFGVSEFANGALRGIVAAAGWDGQIGVIDPLLPADGFVDFLALGAGVSAGNSLGGFSVLFDWFGTGAPGSQPFDVVDAASFAVIRSGFTTPAGAMNVPEAGSGSLFALSLYLLAILRLPARLHAR